MIWINYELALLTQKSNINRFGGIHGVKDANYIHSCIETPLSTFSGEDLYPSIEEKIIQCYYLFCKNHCFNDGNKRISVALLLYLIKMNGLKLEITQKEIIEVTLATASGEYSKEMVSCFISKRLTNIK